MSGRVGDLSAGQAAALADFKNALSDVLKPKHDDHLLLQFLRARKFDVNKSEEMFRRHLLFRKEFDEDVLLNEYKPPEILEKYLQPAFIGYDRSGCPVRIIHVGQQDVKGIVSSFRRPEIRRCVTWFLDKDKAEMKRRSEKTGVWVETRTFIFDLDGLSIRQIYHKEVYELVISFLKLYEYNYPENLEVAYIINTPGFFSWLYNMVKSLLSEDTVNKVKIFGYTGWKEALVERIDPEFLPAHYGGTRTDPNGDPRCPSLIIPAIQIPKQYYLRNQHRLNRDDPDVQSVAVSRRSEQSVSTLVDVPGASLYWEVDCRCGDIDVSLLDAEGRRVFGPQKVGGDLGTDRECHLAETTGKYSLVFDNSFSIFRSKVVLYKFVTSNHTVEGSEVILDR